MSARVALLLFILFSSVGVVAQTSANTGIAIKQHGKSIGSIKLYPVNATTYTNIYIDWNIPLAFTVGVYDSTNKMLKEWKEGPVKNYQKAFYVTQLPPSTYYIKAKNLQGELSEKFIVSHK